MPDSSNSVIGAAALLHEVRTLLEELRGGEALPEPRLDSDLEEELGLDSLSRVELVVRLERRFGRVLPESLAAAAASPGDLLAALQAGDEAPAQAPPQIPGTGPAAPEGAEPPLAAETLNDVLLHHAKRNGERVHVHLHDAYGGYQSLSYADLYGDAMSYAAGLLEQGMAQGEPVAIMLPTGRQYLGVFWGALLAGGAPLPIYPPLRPSQIEEHLRRHAAILDNAGAGLLVTSPEALAPARLLRMAVPTLRRAVTPTRLACDRPLRVRPQLRGEDLALLQYTSGSTGSPKGVMLSHADLLANIRAMGEAIGAGPRDVFVSWLPLYHDMGLIGAWLGSLYFASTLVLMSPLTFLARPERWLRAISQHRGTLAGAPNFAYDLCTRRIDDATLAELDLSSWRFAFNGAEPVSAETMVSFAERFAPAGFAATALAPVYGLAEAAVGLAFPPPGRGLCVDRVERDPLMGQGFAQPCAAEAGAASWMAIPACGKALPGYQLRIVDGAGETLDDRRQGRVQFRGPSATAGYYRNPVATAALITADGWRDSGDLGYLVQGELYLTGRAKDMIIRAGRNLYPAEIEEAVGEIEGVRKGCVAAFGVQSEQAGERLIVAAESRRAGARAEKLFAPIQGRVIERIGVAPDEILLLPPGAVLKTSSGKIRRAACRELYLEGKLGKGHKPPWRQFLSVAMGGLAGLPRRSWRAARAWLVAGWGWMLLVLLAIPVWLAVALLPDVARRWRVAAAASRWLARLTLTPLTLEGRRHAMIEGPCVLVANHRSYLDGLALIAVLPGRWRFVAKRELASQAIAGRFLRRMGVLFVERFDRRDSGRDADELTRAAAEMPPLAVFPEGTFVRGGGLLPFRLGAFVAAVEAGVPVLPVAIRGTDEILPAESWRPARGEIRIRVGEPIQPAGGDWRAAVALRDQARQALEEMLRD